MKIKFLALSLLAGLALSAKAEIAETDTFNRFIDKMVKQHGFSETGLRNAFQTVKIQQSILDAIAKPAEAKPWFQYREIFMTEARIAGGVQFWRENESVLQSIEQQYGVPAEILIAIVGVETRYGANIGKYRVIDALSTLGFAYPPRSDFFLQELENFLLLSRDEAIDPMEPMGSYAGAMGLPQFMPSSFRGYAVDFDHDGKRDIWKNSADALAAIANYFVHNHWRSGAPIAFPVQARDQSYKQALSKGVKPDATIASLRPFLSGIPPQLDNSDSVKLLGFQQVADQELWIGLHNFYVITRYNHSPLYAMAVYQLSQAIAERKKQPIAGITQQPL